MSDNTTHSTEAPKASSPGPDQEQPVRLAAAHNMPPNGASEADEITLSDDGEVKIAPPDLLDA